MVRSKTPLTKPMDEGAEGRAVAFGGLASKGQLQGRRVAEPAETINRRLFMYFPIPLVPIEGVKRKLDSRLGSDLKLKVIR